MLLSNTVDKNKYFFTHQQYERAKRARELYHALSTPSPKEFKQMIMMNAIANNLVTTENIELAQQILAMT